MKSTHVILTAIAGVLTFAGNLSAQDLDTQPEAPTYVGQLHDLRRTFSADRRERLGDFVAERRALRERLASAAEGERREIIKVFRQLHRERIAAERDLRSAYRDQLRELRRAHLAAVRGED